ncbi:MAG: MFS transporter [Pseudomonadota bacterium]
MLASYSRTLPLLIGLFIMMLAGGLNGSLVGLRAAIEDFSTATIGVVLATQSFGFLLGSIFCSKLIKRIGHTRTFALMTATCSVSSLTLAMYVHPVFWMALLLVSGYSFASLFVIVESWVNEATDNEHRGQFMAVYVMVSVVGKLGGYVLLSTADADRYTLFALVSILISLAVVPLLMSTNPEPEHDEPGRVNIIGMFKLAPTGVLGLFLVQSAVGAMNQLGAVYAYRVGLSGFDITIFLALPQIGAMALLLPFGALSDRLDRRLVTDIAGSIAAVCFVIIPFIFDTYSVLSYGILLVAGGCLFSIYSIFVAHVNDLADPAERVSVASTMLLVTGVGQAVGPLVTSTIMEVTNVHGFFFALAGILIIMVGFALARIRIRSSLKPQDRESFVAMPQRATPVIAGTSHRQNDGADGSKPEPSQRP